MPTQLEFPDERRRAVHQAIESMLPGNKKRKRPSHDAQGGDSPSLKRSSLQNINGNGDHMSAAAAESYPGNEFAALQQLQQATSADHTSTAAAALAAQPSGAENGNASFLSTGTGADPERTMDSSFDFSGAESQHQHGLFSLAYGPLTGTAAQVQAARETTNASHIRPAVGTDEWHRVRRDNHKEVERRRRETINEGINELAKIVPGSEKNKGSILARAVTYIMELKAREEQSIEKRTLEMVVLEQAVAELSKQNENLKEELKKAWGEAEKLRKRLGEKGDNGGAGGSGKHGEGDAEEEADAEGSAVDGDGS